MSSVSVSIVSFPIFSRFGEKHVMKVVKWIEECREVSKDSSILDIGCGNGAFLHALVRYYCF